MTIDKNEQETLAFKGFEDLKDRLLYGLPADELSRQTEELIKTSLYIKAASAIRSEKQEIIEIPAQWLLMEAHHFLEAIIESQEKNLIFEWVQILKSKNRCLPANILSSLFEWSIKDLELAHHVIPVLGKAGQTIASVIPAWNLFSETKWKHAFQFEKPEMRVFAFRQFHILDSENAFNYFLQHHEQLKEAEKLKVIRILSKNITSKELETLIELFNSGKSNIQSELTQLALRVQDSAYYDRSKVKFQNLLKSDSLDNFQFDSLGNKENKWTNALKIKFTPPSFLTEQNDALKYIEWIEKNGEEESLLEALQLNPDTDFLNWYFDYLLQNDKLDEHFPTGKLSRGMDYKTFNQACIHWIDTCADKTDLEAFLHFINLEKHFWSDELLAKILGLREHKSLNRKYDFTIFWQLLPYKVNPNSVHIKSIPAECRMFESNLINFDSVLQFRKWIRQ